MQRTHVERVPTSNDKLIAAATHLSYLIGLPIVIPALVYIWKRDTSPFIADHAKQALGCHVVALAAWFVLFIVFVGAMSFPIAQLLMMLYGAGCLVVIVLTVVAAMRVADGKPYRYPLIGAIVQRF